MNDNNHSFFTVKTITYNCIQINKAPAFSTILKIWGLPTD